MSQSTRTSTRVTRWLSIALLVVAYPALAHYTIENVQNGKLGAVVALAPACVVSVIFAWKATLRWLWFTLLALALVVVAASWRLFEHHFGLVYWLQDTGMQAILFMTFARTLFPGRKPLCTHFAELTHGKITPQHAHYAHQVTWAWAMFFAMMVIASTGLFFLAPLPVWSVFANFLTLPLVILMFVLEFLVRRVLLPEMRTSHFLETFRISWNSLRHPDAPTRRPQSKA